MMDSAILYDKEGKEIRLPKFGGHAIEVKSRYDAENRMSITVNIINDELRRWSKEIDSEVKRQIVELFMEENSCSIEHIDDEPDVPEYFLSCGHAFRSDMKPEYCLVCGRKIKNETY